MGVDNNRAVVERIGASNCSLDFGSRGRWFKPHGNRTFRPLVISARVESVDKVNKILGLIKCSFVHLDRELIMAMSHGTHTRKRTRK